MKKQKYEFKIAQERCDKVVIMRAEGGYIIYYSESELPKLLTLEESLKFARELLKEEGEEC